MSQNGFNKWIMTGHIVADSREEDLETDHGVPFCRFKVRDSIYGMEWNAVAFGHACEHIEENTQDDTLYIFEGVPKQHIDGKSDLDVPAYHMQVLFVRGLPTDIHAGRHARAENF